MRAIDTSRLVYLGQFIELESVFLFGSSLLIGDEPNDLDILVISPSFAHMSMQKRKQIVRKCVDIDGLDPVCISSLEFEQMKQNPSTFLISIINNAVEVNLPDDPNW